MLRPTKQTKAEQPSTGTRQRFLMRPVLAKTAQLEIIQRAGTRLEYRETKIISFYAKKVLQNTGDLLTCVCHHEISQTMKPPIKPTILRALRSGKPVTLSKLVALTNSTKVASRISELRRDGHNIVNRTFYKNGEFQKSTYTLL